jgi:uncharacterized membrane protein YhhN
MSFIDILKSLPIVSYIFFGLFLVASIVQVILAALDLDKIRRIEKSFCLLFLTIFVVVTVPTSPFVYIGAFLSMMGDLLLAFRKKILFYIGSFTFAASHIFYLVSIIQIVDPLLPWFVYVIAAVVVILFYLATTNLIAKRLTKSKFEQYSMMAYFTILFYNFLIMMMATINLPLFLFITAIGGFIFIISDSCIVYNQFYKPIKNAEVIVMSTYLVAQALIVIGLVFTILR